MLPARSRSGELPANFLLGPRVNEDLSNLREPVTGERLARDGDLLFAPSGQSFPIINGIPRFVGSEDYAADFGAQWKRFPKTQLDSHTKAPISHDRLARCFAGELPNVSGRRVLEVGSGAGRFTEVLLDHGAKLDSLDMSTAVEANALNNGARPFTLVQADARAMPFERSSYDYVVCLGVLQHTPDTEESIAKLWEMVKPGGRLVIDHYDWNRWRLPPPIGGAAGIYRRYMLRLSPEKRWSAIKRHVDRWFPLYWRYRNSRWAIRVLSRVAGLNFYYGALPLRTREDFYEWSLLDTHDALTDVYKRYRTAGSIRRTLQRLGATDIRASQGSLGIEGGNGVEASCQKPL
jgi:SAM-dependent methyltransferase